MTMERIAADLSGPLHEASNRWNELAPQQSSRRKNSSRNYRGRPKNLNENLMVETMASPSDGAPDSPVDTNIPQVITPNAKDESKKKVREKEARRTKGSGRNTESFDPSSTLQRPDLRVRIASSARNGSTISAAIRHDDVIIVPELFGCKTYYSLYHRLVQEMEHLQQQNIDGSQYISWHEGAHSIVKNPKLCPTFHTIVKKLCDYFQILNSTKIGTRFNYYKDSEDWKPFHHDSAAFNAQRAKTQNITIGASFGAARELAFLRADDMASPCRIYFPQCNNGVFTFGRDVNIRWKHGINALPTLSPSPEPSNDASPMGRISIVVWGNVNAVEEENSPPLLGSDGQGPHAAKTPFPKSKKSGSKKGNQRNISTLTESPNEK